jgi:alanine racemase
MIVAMNRIPDPQTLVPDPTTLRTAAPAEAECGGILTINLAAIVANWRTLASEVVPVECAAVIKADAYGCGIEPVAMALAQAGCRTFFVADLVEARRVREVAREADIYVLGGLIPGTAAAYAECDARPVINSPTDFAEWDAFVSANNWRGGAALHVDTGMNRLGVTGDEAAALAPRIQRENHGIMLLMSHLACAEIPDHPLNDKQIALFREIRMLFRGVPASLANSSGIFLGPSTHYDLVRPGIALYGGNPTPRKPNPMQPVVELQGRIVQVRHLDRGDTVGYGATWKAKRPSRIAVVAVGYADGYLRAASAADGADGGRAVVSGKLCPLAGRVSMDLLAVDVTDLPERSAHRGDLVTLIGDKIGVDDMAAFGRTISYEVLTGLGRRHQRSYRGE